MTPQTRDQVSEMLAAAATRMKDIQEIALETVEFNGFADDLGPGELGNCYEVAYYLLDTMGRDDDTFRMVHADVQSPETELFHGHAWIEVEIEGTGVWAVDYSNGNRTLLPVELYRRAARAKNAASYGWLEAAKLALETGNFGFATDNEEAADEA